MGYKEQVLEIQQLISFWHVSRLGSVSKASDVVCRTQPAVSQQVKALEDEIGCLLFHRLGKRKLVLTEEGKVLQEFVRSFVAERDRALEDIHILGGSKRGKVSVAAPFTTCFQVLPQVLKCFADCCPDVCVSVFDRPQDAAVVMLRDGEVDFAIVLESLVPRGLHSIPWKRVIPVLIVPRGHALARRKEISITEIAKQKLIMPPAHMRHPGRILLEKAARAAGCVLNIMLECANVELSARWVEEGLGVSFATVLEDASFAKGRDLHFLSLGHLLQGGNLAIAMRDIGSIRGIRKEFVETLLAI